MVEIGAVGDSNDSSPNRDFELGAALNAADGYNPASTLIPINRAGGITRAVGVPSVGGSLFGGRAILIDMTGGPNSIMREDVAQSLLLDSGAASREGGTRMGAWAIAREILDEAQLYANDPAGYRRLASDGRYKVTDLAALQPVLAGRVPLFVSVNRAADIRNVIRFKNDYGLKLIIVGGAEAWREARALAAADIPVIVDALANLPGDFESLSSTLKNAALLNQAGVEISFYNPPGFGAHNLRLLTQLAGNAVADGLPFDAALAALTLYPARMFGIDGELGTLEVGKRADIVVWDGDPLELSTHVVTVLIDGQVQDLRNRQQMLSERYRTLIVVSARTPIAAAIRVKCDKSGSLVVAIVLADNHAHQLWTTVGHPTYAHVSSTGKAGRKGSIRNSRLRRESVRLCWSRLHSRYCTATSRARQPER